MMHLWYRRYILPASTLSGTIIGAGMFALPYAVIQAGWGVGLLYGVALSALLVTVHAMFLRVILETREHYRFVGYVRKYLGEASFVISLLTAVVGMALTLTIYLILSSRFTGLFYGEGEVYRVGIFWALASLAMFVRARLLAMLEYLFLVGMLCIIGVVFFVGVGNIGDIGTMAFVEGGDFFLPFGVILFALVGRSAIPSVVRYYKESGIPSGFAKRSVILGTLAPAVLYAGFVIGVMGISSEVSPDTVSGLMSSAPLAVVLAVGILGLLSIFSTYVVLGIDVAENLSLELKVPRPIALGAAIVTPIVCYLVGMRDFLGLVGIVGGIFVSIEGIMIVCMWRKIVSRSLARNLSLLAVGIFLLGAWYEIMKLS